jgi:hypothetical protein
VAERNYKQMFSEDFPIEHYSKCAQILKRIDQFLDGYSREDRNNIVFHLAMYAACTALKSPEAAEADNRELNDGPGALAPDWSRVGTDVTAQGPFNASFSLSGQALPEPSSLWLLAIGLAGMVLIRLGLAQ